MTLLDFIYSSLYLSAFFLLLIKIIDISKSSTYINNFIYKLDIYIEKSTSKKAFLVILFVIFVFSSVNKTYYLGGDDSRIFYLYPDQYLQNFALNISSNLAVSGLTGFLSPLTIMPFIAMLSVIKKLLPFINLQSFFYTANILIAYYSFFYLLKLIYPKKFKYKYVSLFAVSFMYVTSIFNVYSLFNSRLLAIYLMSVVPILLILFIKSVREKRIINIFLISLIMTLFSVITVSLPWFAAAVICIAPFYIYLLRNHFIRIIKYSSLLAILLIILNLFWIIYLPKNSSIESVTAVGEEISSGAFIDQNILGIIATAEINNVFYPLNNLYHYKIQKNFNWPYWSTFNNWHSNIVFLNIIYIFTIVYAGISISRNKGGDELFGYSLLTLLISIYFYTVGIRGFGINLFIFLTKNIPGFVMFRNMYDKFAYPVAFSFALIIFLSLAILSKKLSRKVYSLLILLLIFVSLLNAKPFILGEYRKLPVWTTEYTHEGITSFNSDYLDLIDYVSNLETDSRFLQLPLANGNLAQIYDSKDQNRIYTGVSPFIFLSGKNDLSGIASFENRSKSLKSAILNGRFYEAGIFFKKLGVSYVVVQNDISDDIKYSYIYTDNLYDSQNEEFYDLILGEKIKDFGDRYSLYYINDDFRSEKIAAINKSEISLLNPEIKLINYQKLDNSTFEIDISSLTDDDHLIFLEPFSYSWSINSESADNIIFDYGMAWTSESINNSSSSNKIILKSDLFTKADNKSLSSNIIQLDRDERFDAVYIKNNPFVYIKPGDKKYWFLTRIYEPFQVFTKQRDNLFFADKRVAELETWVDTELPLDDILDLYQMYMLNAIYSSGMDKNRKLISEEIKQIAARLPIHEELITTAVKNNLKDKSDLNIYIKKVEDIFDSLNKTALLDKNKDKSQFFIPDNIKDPVDVYIFTPNIDTETVDAFYNNKELVFEKVNSYLYEYKNLEINNNNHSTLQLDIQKATIYINIK